MRIGRECTPAAGEGALEFRDDEEFKAYAIIRVTDVASGGARDASRMDAG
jgi:hypothetical protein